MRTLIQDDIETADYILTMVEQLETMAIQSDLRGIAYYLSMARAEGRVEKLRLEVVECAN